MCHPVVAEDLYLSQVESFYGTQTIEKHSSQGHSIPKGDKKDFVERCKGSVLSTLQQARDWICRALECGQENNGETRDSVAASAATSPLQSPRSVALF